MKKITLLMLIVFTTISLQAQTKILSSIHESFFSGNWYNSYATNYEYDANNNLTAEISLEWDNTNSQWKIREKVIYTYNASNQVTSEVGQKWDVVTGAYINSYRDTYSYTNGKFTQQIGDEWVNSNWVSEWKMTIAYNANNLPETALSYSWIGGQWVNDYSDVIAYDVNNKPTGFTSKELKNGVWVNSYRSTLSYSLDKSKIIKDNYEDWNAGNSSWVQGDVTDYTFDPTGNRVRLIESYGDGDRQRTDYTYDSSSLMANFAHPFKDKTGVEYLDANFPYVNKVLTEVNYYYDKVSTYILSGRTTYNYNSSITLATEKFEAANAVTVSVFPNPTQDYLSIQTSVNKEIDKVVVTDLSGKTVLQQNKVGNQINVQNLAKGVYLLQVVSGDQKWDSKFIKN